MGGRLATIDMGRKVGAAMPLSGREGELCPHLTQCHLGWGLPPYQMAYSSIPVFGDNRHGPKSGAAVPLLGRELGYHLTQCACAKAYLCTKWHLDPSNRLATIYQRYKTDRQTMVR